MEKLRVGRSTAALLTMISGVLGGSTIYEASHVFPELGDIVPIRPEQTEDDMRAALSLFPGVRRVHHA